MGNLSAYFRIFFGLLGLAFATISFAYVDLDSSNTFNPGQNTKTTSPIILKFSDIADSAPNSRAAQQILREAYKKLDIEIEIKILPNSRTVSLLELNELDGLVYRVANVPLYDLSKINVPILFEEIHAFTVDHPIEIESYLSLKPYSIGFFAGSRIFEDRLKGMRVDTAPSEESLLRKLAMGRTQMAVSTRSSFCRAKKLGLPSIRILEPALEKILGYHWLSDRHQHLYPKIERVLKTMEKNGRIKQINEEMWKSFDEECANHI
jgi:hypothetical protein